ncbi:hypothetical protein SADUNF_Sadunf16G0082100 [Salix dunnii]|uniref:Transcription initiation factor TFIID subunit 8 n=1 Tax=Salix dunnii TaxID=1413687 RepID=A0A835JB13_9ROSI|nr:hypothetical protein SADUNF_Sadunf16G0082100 [Salix dunnii]
MRNGGEENTPRRLKSDDFGRAVSRMAVAQICEGVGFDGFKKSALDSLNDITIQYLGDLGKTASFYSNFSGVSQGFLCASSSDNCLVNFGTIKELIDFVGSNDEIPFVHPVPRFSVIRDRKFIPIFEKISEVPPGKHIPAWLPALPDPHTYLHTPMWNERLLDPHADKKRLLSNGSVGASTSGIGDNVKESRAVYNSQSLAMPLESEKKDVSPAFAPAFEAAKEGGICDDGDFEGKTLSEQRLAVTFKLKTRKKVFGSESFEEGWGRIGHWLGWSDERDDKKRRANGNKQEKPLSA